MDNDKILLAHGSGGKAMHNLIKESFLRKLRNPILSKLQDAACIGYKEKIAFTTDSFVVSPLFFPGADIGKLAVCGTINDLVVTGAVPEYLSLSLIMEEGLEKKTLEKIIDSIALAAKKARVQIVTGDSKVVEKGACDKIFINTSGLGRIVEKKELSLTDIRQGDKIILTGTIAEHGLAVLSRRNDLSFGFNIKSDCASLEKLLLPLLNKNLEVKFMRDPTRGGLAVTLNEIASDTGLGIIVDEKLIPISQKARVACELLGIDPLYVANEGKAVVIVGKNKATQALKILKKHYLGANAEIIGEVRKDLQRKVVLKTAIGSWRVLDMPASEILPRIC